MTNLKLTAGRPARRSGTEPLTRTLLGRSSQITSTAAATALLFLVSAVAVHGAVSSTAIRSMLPLAGILAVASLGQMLIVQQRGFDFSVAGVMSLTAIIVTRYPHGAPGRLPPAIVIALVISALIGTVTGLAVTRFRIPPIVATLAVNSLILGGIQSYSGGIALTAPSALSNFMVGRAAGVANPMWLAIGITVGLGLWLGLTKSGRRFVATGTSLPAARAAGIRVVWVQATAYIVAALLYSAAGILLAGYLGTPTADIGTPYLLSTIAAVIVGGTLLTGGRGSAIATLLGALFLSQLNSVINTLGAASSVQLLVEGGALATALTLRRLWELRMRRARSRAATPRRIVGSTATEDDGLTSRTMH